MSRPIKNSLRYLAWLQKIMFLWVRSKVFPKDLLTSLPLDPQGPVVYVLKARSLTDLFVLDEHCRREGLPRPQLTPASLLSQGRGGSYIYLTKAGLLQQKRAKPMPTALFQLVDQAALGRVDVQLVPVAVFWGRNPGREDPSLLRLMFFDDEHGGFFQRFFTFFLQGRNVFCHFGKPIPLLRLVDEGHSLEESTKKLRRVLRVHFRSQRDIVLGPHVYNRAGVIRSLVQAKTVVKMIEQEAQKRRSSVVKVETAARRYADEVTSRFSHHAIRFLDRLLTWLWRKIYAGVEVKNDARLREIAEGYELVYMPCHRSHMDYLLLGYILYYLGMMPPHTVAGINLNFWPIGPILRRGGAIFIRRTFRGNRLYGAVVSEFVHYLITTGFPIGFYPEGGRSRTGRILKPKMGILSMVVQSYRRDARKPIMLVPVYIGYDRVMEVRSYLGELHGKGKKKESIAQLLKAWQVVRSDFGKAYIGFGEPLELGTFLAQHGLANLEDGGESDKEGQALTPVIAKLAREMSVRTARAAIVSPVALFASILLATPKKAMGEEDLLAAAQKWLRLLEACPYALDSSFSLDASRLSAELAYVEKMAGLRRFKHPTGDVIYVGTEEDSLTLSYYRNNIVHLLVVPSILAGFLRYNDVVEREALLAGAAAMYHLVRDEYFLPWSSEELSLVLSSYLARLVELGLIVALDDGRSLQRPALVERTYSYFRIVGNVMADELERYAIFTQLLARYGRAGAVGREAFERECRMMSERLAILGGMSDSPLYEAQSYRSFLEALVELNYIHVEGDKILLAPSTSQLAASFEGLLGLDVLQSLQRMPLLEAAEDPHRAESSPHAPLEKR